MKNCSPQFNFAAASADEAVGSSRKGALIINADDWGRDCETTDRTLNCIRVGSVSAVSAMVFMEDSERAAALAQEHGIDVGLHLNFTLAYSGAAIESRLRDHQAKLGQFLSRHAFARAIHNPTLANSFEYVVTAQIEEYRKLYGTEPYRIDGHHHMHLSANVLLGGLLRPGTIVRRHFSYEAGEKIFRNSVFRLFSAALLGRRYRVTDYFFSLPPLAPQTRLDHIVNSAQNFIVEVETHPINPDEFRFLTQGDLPRWTKHCPVAPFGKAFALHHA